MKRQWMGLVIATAFLLASSSAWSQAGRYAYEDRRLDALRSENLTRFDGERDFRQYLRTLRREAERRGVWWAEDLPDGGKQKFPPDAEPCAPDETCEHDLIVVTASRIAAPNPVITNNQEAGVDEGDIVKQIGDHLVVLQDGRLFSVDLRGNAGMPIAFADRIDVYTAPDRDIWYDEMLVSGNRIIVTGYSYEDNASEITLLDLDAQGRFVRLDAFQISSNDYYDVDNYATRLVDGRLVIHVPLYLADLDFSEDQPWPVMRRWESAPERQQSATRRMFGARDIYRPVQSVLQPVLHTISSCRIDAPAGAPFLECDTAAFIGGEESEFYVSPAHAYLWSAPGYDETDPEHFAAAAERCAAKDSPDAGDVLPAAVHRMELTSGRLEVAAAAGLPNDQFALDSAGGRFRALVSWRDPHCLQAWNDPNARAFLAFVDMPERRFGQRLGQVSPHDYTRLPGIPSPFGLENRFTADHLVYGWSRGGYSYVPDADSRPLKTGRLAILPLDEPEAVITLDLTHSLLRLEVLGDGLIATGYVHTEGTHLSRLELAETPRISDTVLLANRFETEGRSHAFNATLRPDGSALLGLPTTIVPPRFRWWFRSTQSDISFLALNTDGAFARLGELSGDGEAEAYVCEVSCVDWYGNSRPIFTGDRIFALSGSDIIEGRLFGDQLKPVARLDLTVPQDVQQPDGSLPVPESSALN